MIRKNMKQEKTLREKYRELDEFKKIHYTFHDLIKTEGIYSKLPQELIFRIKDRHSSLNFLKNFFLSRLLVFWKIFLIKSEYFYYKIKYPTICTLQDIQTDNFDYLFVLNTRDHTITALPVLESMDNEARILVVTFKSVYTRYKHEFDNLKNTKVIVFDYELKNLPLTKYLRINEESQDNFRLLQSQNLDSDLKRLIELDKNFIKYHLKTELVQYYFFEKVFTTFDIKGAVSIVFTTAFELCKERGIPTFVLQHGIGGKGHGHPYVSDYWFTFDDVSKESLDEWLDHTVNVMALGSPRFEYFAKSSENLKRKDFNKKISKSINMKNVTYISAGTEDFEDENIVSALQNLREKLPDDVNLIIKLHPREILKFSNLKKQIRKIFSKPELKKTVFIRKEIDFYELLANSNIVVTLLSTGAQESIAMDIPVLQVNFTGKPYPKSYDFSTFGWKEPITDPDVMIKEVLSILNDKKRYDTVIEKQIWLKNRMFPNFGRCGKVISETILDICKDAVEK